MNGERVPLGRDEWKRRCVEEEEEEDEEGEAENEDDESGDRVLKEEELLEDAFAGSISDVFTFERFKNARNNQVNFSKYLLMRIDRYFSKLLDKPSYCNAPASEIEERFNKTNRRRYGMHLEHIYAHNSANHALFTDPVSGLFDSATFDQTRNQMGMVLLLKDLQNLSSSNDIYSEKLEDYASSNMIWNEILADGLPGVDAACLPPVFRNAFITADQSGAFPIDKVEIRQRLFFEAVKTIWAQV